MPTGHLLRSKLSGHRLLRCSELVRLPSREGRVASPILVLRRMGRDPISGGVRWSWQARTIIDREDLGL